MTTPAHKEIRSRGRPRDFDGTEFRVVLLLMLCWVCSCVQRASAGPTPNSKDDLFPLRVSVTRYTTESGLPQSRVHHLAQTPDGYLWCGTWMGLARFDGMRFTVFDGRNTPAFRNHDDIRGVVTDAAGGLWVASARALALRMPGMSGFQEIASDGKSFRDVSNLYPARSNGVWLLRVKSVEHLDDRSRVVEQRQLPAWASEANQLVEGASGSLGILQHFGPSHCLGWWSPGSKDWSVILKEGAPIQPGDLIGPSGNGALVLRARQLIRVDEEGVSERMLLPEPLQRAGVAFGGLGRQDHLWLVGMDGSLWLHQAAGCRRVETSPPVALREPLAILEDSDANVWVGAPDGLFRLTPIAARTFTSRDGLPHDNVLSVQATPDGGIWAATSTGIVRIHQGRVAIKLPQIAWGVSPTFVSAIETHEGLVVAASTHGGGLSRWFHGAWSAWHEDIEDPVALYEDGQRRLWVGARKGVACMDRDTRRGWGRTNGLPANNVRVILQTRDAAMWFGTRGGGLARLREGTGDLRYFDHTDGLSSAEVWALHEATNGALWVGGNNGLHYLSPPLVREESPMSSRISTNRSPSASTGRTIINLDKSHGLAENAVNWILDDGQGYLWLSGLRGIHRVPLADLLAVVLGEADQVRCLTLGAADGLEGPETNGEQQPAGAVDSSGKLWFPSNTGVVSIDPSPMGFPDRLPHVIIEDVHVDGHRITMLPQILEAAAASSLKLPQGSFPTVRIDFTAPTFVNPERTRFRYRLSGLGEEWTEARSERSAYFTHLRPGEYVFEVTACNPHGIWQTTPARIAMSLPATFTQKPVFPFTIAGGAGLLLAGLVAWRLSWQRRALRAEGEALLADERSRIAADLHDDLGTALTGLALELDVVRQESPRESRVARRLSETSSRVRRLADRMREVVWAVNPRCDTVASLAQFIEQQTEQFQHQSRIRWRLSFPVDLPASPIDSIARHHLALAVREALHNAIKHSSATEISLSLELVADAVIVQVRDNGCGFSRSEAEGRGHGLSTMKDRLAKVGGRMECRTSPGEGVVLLFHVPLRLPRSNERKHP